jgi:hypothetical protein
MSLRKTMEKVYGVSNIGRPWWGTHVEEPINKEMREKSAWYGHFHFGLHHHLGRPVKYITILREPAERVLSEYRRNRYRERYGWEPIDLIRSDDSQAVALAGNNMMVRMLSGSNPDTQLTNSHIDIAINNLSEHFIFVGFTHRYHELESFVREHLGWPIQTIPHINKGLPGDVSDAEIKELKRSPELELDYKLWHRVRPSYLTNEEVKELLARGAKGVEELRSSLRRMSSVPVGGPRFR